jgi:eukaryotic-like serine/threonine-protein kinase
MSVSEGQLLAGKYRVERVLGQGGMGVVVAAHHIVLDQRVALKFLLPESRRRTDAVARFEREARAAAKIQSEHVARVMDVGRLDDGTPYMVMELLRGRDLQVLLRERGPLPLDEVADYVLQ